MTVPPGSLREVEDHLAGILTAAARRRARMTSETIATVDASGRVLTADAVARVDIPVFDNSAMDGFAVRFDDVAGAAPDAPITLQVVADLPAGTGDDPAIAAGEAARIMTGSPVPSDADAIVPFEDTVEGLADSLGTITVVATPRSRGAHIRRRAEDVHAGDTVLPAGTAIGPWQVGALAAAGVAHVDVVRRPRVAVVSTGSELAAPGEPLRPGQIPESNSALLAALAADAGAEVVLRTTVDDEGDGPRKAITAAQRAEADAVVFTGGVSAGAYEVVKNTLGDVMSFTKVAMQPGKPQGFGATADGVLLFGLPGNPVSAAVSFEVFVRPALRALQGLTPTAPLLRLTADTGWRTPPGRRQYLPVCIDRSDPAAWRVVPATSGGSHLAGGHGRAEAYAVVPAHVTAVHAGDAVDVMLVR